MEAKIARYLAKPSATTARALLTYLDKHPMAESLASTLEAALIAEARGRAA